MNQTTFWSCTCTYIHRMLTDTLIVLAFRNKCAGSLLTKTECILKPTGRSRQKGPTYYRTLSNLWC